MGWTWMQARGLMAGGARGVQNDLFPTVKKQDERYAEKGKEDGLATAAS